MAQFTEQSVLALEEIESRGNTLSIEFGLWRVDGSEPQRLELSGNDLERNLQQWLIKDLSIITPELMLLGAEVHAFDNERIDLLAIDRAGKLYVLELKRGIARRDIVAQLLDYGAWVAKLELSDLNAIFDKCPNRRPAQTLDDAFKARFNEPLPDSLDAGHELWMVISGMDTRTEQLCNITSLSAGRDENGRLTYWHAK